MNQVELSAGAGFVVSWDGSRHRLEGTPVREHEPATRGSGVRFGRAQGCSFDGETVRIATDRFGYAPIYVAQNHERIAVGSSPVATAARFGSVAPDGTAIGLYLRIGFYLGDATPFGSVRRVPAGEVMTWTRGEASVPPSPSYRKHAAVRGIEEAIEGFAHCFRRAMERRTPTESNYLMPLSGGRDSRMMLAQACAMGAPPTSCITLGAGAADADVVVARELAAKLGVAAKWIGFGGRRWVDDELRKQVSTGMETVEHTWLMPLWEYMRGRSAFWYDGLGVGAMTRGDLINQQCAAWFEQGNWMALLRFIQAKALGHTQEEIDYFASSVPWLEPSEEAAAAMLGKEMTRYVGAANPPAAFAFMNWGRRAISLNPTSLCADVPVIHTPFMDEELVDFVSGIPLEIALQNDIQTDACKRMFPRIADVPFDKDVDSRPVTTRGLLDRLTGRGHLVSVLAGLGSTSRRAVPEALLHGGSRTVRSSLTLDLIERCCTPKVASELLARWGLGSPLDQAAVARSMREAAG